MGMEAGKERVLLGIPVTAEERDRGMGQVDRAYLLQGMSLSVETSYVAAHSQDNSSASAIFRCSSVQENPTVSTCLSMLRQKSSHKNIYIFVSTFPSQPPNQDPKKLATTQQLWQRSQGLSKSAAMCHS